MLRQVNTQLSSTGGREKARYIPYRKKCIMHCKARKDAKDSRQGLKDNDIRYKKQQQFAWRFQGRWWTKLKKKIYTKYTSDSFSVKYHLQNWRQHGSDGFQINRTNTLLQVYQTWYQNKSKGSGGCNIIQQYLSCRVLWK